jgi:thioesterase domain-containing protein
VQVTDLFQHRTIEQLASLLDERRATAGRSPVLRFGPDGAPNIFCIPGINGHAMSFKDLAAALPGHALQCLEPIDLRGTALVPLDSLDSLCRGYLALLKEVQGSGPYRLLGHSFGGLVALRLAEMLEQQGELVAWVGLIDTFAHALDAGGAAPPADLGAFSAGYVHHIFARFEQYLDCELGIAVDSLAAMSENERIFHLATQLALHQIIPRHDPQLVRSYLQGRQVHENTMLAYYRGPARPRFGGKVGLFKAGEALPGQDMRADYGWRAWLAGDLQVRTVPGDHESLITPAHAPGLGAAVAQLFD